AVERMKAEGLEYEARMELLESVTYPQPLVELLEHGYEVYRQGHPGVADYELAPKSVARDLAEQAMTFPEDVAYYGLARSEGLVLRYVADAYKALRQTVPEEARTEELTDLIEWLGELVRQVDSSLLDEWERLRDPEAVAESRLGGRLDDTPPPVTANQRAFGVLVRNAMFRRVELAARRRWAELGELDGADGWDADAWAKALEPYFEEHAEIGTGANARGPALLLIDRRPARWLGRQVFAPPAGDHDWGISAEADLPASDDAGTAVLQVTAVSQL